MVGDLDGYVHWLATEDGRMLARERVGGGAIRVKPLVVDGVVYVLSDNGQLTALRAESLDAE